MGPCIALEVHCGLRVVLEPRTFLYLLGAPVSELRFVMAPRCFFKGVLGFRGWDLKFRVLGLKLQNRV